MSATNLRYRAETLDQRLMEFTEQTWWFLNATATGKTETAKRAVRSRGCGEIRFLCAEHVRQLEGGSPLDNLMEVKS